MDNRLVVLAVILLIAGVYFILPHSKSYQVSVQYKSEGFYLRINKDRHTIFEEFVNNNYTLTLAEGYYGIIVWSDVWEKNDYKVRYINLTQDTWINF